jgi:molybdate transport system regulatory protein
LRAIGYSQAAQAPNQGVDVGTEVQFRLRISRGEEIAVGPGKIALLEAIIREGSINSAAKQLKMSYRRAWMLVDAMNRSMKRPVVETATGGSHGGGTIVTVDGHKVIDLYRRIERDAAAVAAKDLLQLTRMLAKDD